MRLFYIFVLSMQVEKFTLKSLRVDSRLRGNDKKRDAVFLLTLNFKLQLYTFHFSFLTFNLFLSCRQNAPLIRL